MRPSRVACCAVRLPTDRLAPQVADAKESPWLKTAAQVAGFGVGGAAYAYLVGGAYLYVQLKRAGLSPDTGLSDVSTREILVRGVPILLLGVPLTAAVTVIANYLWRLAYRATHKGHPPSAPAPVATDESSAGDEAAQESAIQRETRRGVAAALIAIFAAIGLDVVVAESLVELLAAVSVAGAASIGAVVAIPLAFGRRLPDPGRPGAIAWLIAVASAATLLGSAVFAAQADLKLPVALVMRTDDTCVRGALIAVDAVGVHLADGVSKQIETLPSSQVTSVSSGPDADTSRIRLAQVSCAKIN